ncbi:MAG: ribosomal-processing cysteine protease Prp [Spirochaetes bacterium]|nr:ribosomal-processing cysteine protease Prp [Spirochaetota bacterium]
MLEISASGLSDQGFVENEKFALSVKGHALYSVKGGDIVCAAVSTLFFTAQSALVKLAGCRIEIMVSDSESFIRFDPHESDPEKALVVIETVLVGLSRVADNYPEYCKIIIERR